MKYKKYTKDDVTQVRELFTEGLNRCQISRQTNIPLSTLRKWLNHDDFNLRDDRNAVKITDIINDKIRREAYSFCLGIYLCDGYIVQSKQHRVPNITFYNDYQYPINTREWCDKIQIIFPENKVNCKKKPSSNCVIVKVYNNCIWDLFPQHGKGKKHDRKLILEDWQKEIIKEFPEEFIKACVQSDGCIYIQKVSNRQYHRHNFINKSEDIIDFFLWALSLVGIQKKKYYNPNRGLFVVQNFNKEQEEILNNIIKTKE